jgi:hypothetical protein
VKTNNPHDLASLEAKLKATQKKLAEAILQRDFANRLLRRQTLANVQLQRQIMFAWHLSIGNLSQKIYRILYLRLRPIIPKPLKQFIKRYFFGIKS